MSAYEQFNFAGWNDENVFGYVMKPKDFRRDKQYPVALLVHGGPQGSMANLWHWRWNAQTFAGAGFAVVMIDFHGSTGYGQAFTDSISGRLGRPNRWRISSGDSQRPSSSTPGSTATGCVRSADPTAAT